MSVFAATLRPSRPILTLFYSLVAIIGSSLMLGLLAQFEIPLWFTPVPITLQSLGVLLIGALLGSKKGSLAIIAYLTEGACGLPVFAGGGAGAAILLGPTAGYLYAFVVGAYIVGFLFERGWDRHTLSLVALFALSSSLILILGGSWLGLFVGFERAWMLGIYPFLLGTLLKVITVTALVKLGRPILSSHRKYL